MVRPEPQQPGEQQTQQNQTLEQHHQHHQHPRSQAPVAPAVPSVVSTAPIVPDEAQAKLVQHILHMGTVGELSDLFLTTTQQLPHLTPMLASATLRRLCKLVGAESRYARQNRRARRGEAGGGPRRPAQETDPGSSVHSNSVYSGVHNSRAHSSDGPSTTYNASGARDEVHTQAPAPPPAPSYDRDRLQQAEGALGDPSSLVEALLEQSESMLCQFDMSHLTQVLLSLARLRKHLPKQPELQQQQSAWVDVALGHMEALLPAAR